MVSRKPKPQSYDVRNFGKSQDETSTTMKEFIPNVIDGNNWQQNIFLKVVQLRGGNIQKQSPHSVGISTTHSIPVPLVFKFPPKFSTQKALAQATSLCTTLHRHTLWPMGTLWHPLGTPHPVNND